MERLALVLIMNLFADETDSPPTFSEAFILAGRSILPLPQGRVSHSPSTEQPYPIFRISAPKMGGRLLASMGKRASG